MKLKTINIFLVVLVCGLSIFCAFILLNGNKGKTPPDLIKSEEIDDLPNSDESHKQIANPQENLTQFVQDESSVSSPDNILQQILNRAEAGDVEAQYKLGLMYSNGDGVPQDYKEAFKWVRQAAEQGDVEAQYNLGAAYFTGQGVIKDEKEGIKWCTKAAEQGHAKAQYGLSAAYLSGQGVIKDEKEALKWCTKAAEQGLANAQYFLGVMYEKVDDKEASKWYAKAAEQGFAAAQFKLGVMYQAGKGVKQSDTFSQDEREEQKIHFIEKFNVKVLVDAQCDNKYLANQFESLTKRELRKLVDVTVVDIEEFPDFEVSYIIIEMDRRIAEGYSACMTVSRVWYPPKKLHEALMYFSTHKWPNKEDEKLMDMNIHATKMNRVFTELRYPTLYTGNSNQIESQLQQVVADFDQNSLEPLRRKHRDEKKSWEDMGYKVIEK